MFNPELTELPEHGHYSACRGRMTEIDAYCRRCFACTAIICTAMIVLTWMTLRFSVISLIPNLIGDGSNPAGNLIQTLILLGIIVMSGLSTGKYKIFNAVIFLLYCAMLICCAFSRNPGDIFTSLFSIAGIIFTFRSIKVFLDYRQLSRTEGFPDFNERLTYQEEHREYTPYHTGDNSKNNMDEI